MKTNYQTLSMKLIFLLTLFVMLLQSCSKEPDLPSGNPITKYEYLTAGALNQTPYFTNPAFDTISFASDKGDTLSFVKTKTDTSWYCENQSLSSNYKICYQTLHNTYTTIKGVGSFDVKHSRKIDYKDLTDIISMRFNSIDIWVLDVFIGTKTSTFSDSLIFNNKTYYSTLYTYHQFEYLDVAKNYLNKTYGVFRIEDNINNTIWSLIK
jgi:hypothetical protein